MLTTALNGVVTKQPLDKLLMNIAMTGAMTKDGKLPTDSMTVTPDPANLEDFLMSLEKYKVDQNADATGPGYYNEITGKFIPSANGVVQSPLGNDTGNLDPNKQWEYNLTRPGVWADADGNELDMSYLPNSETTLTGEQIMRNANALPKTNIKIPTTKTTDTTTPDSSPDGLSFMNPATSQESYADIKSMEELFGGDIGYKLRDLGANPSQKTASEDMDKLVKLLRG